MDKQQYIIVTNEHSYKQGLIYPVKEYTEDRRFWRIVGTNQVIAKEDCEPYEFPTLPTDSEDIAENMYQLANDFVKEWYPDYASDKQQGLINAFKAGYKEAYPLAFDRGFKQAQRNPVQEGHTITTEQLIDLHESLGDCSVNRESLQVSLKSWFPTVFKPERIYQPGTRFIVGDDELMLTKTGELWRMVDLNTGKGANRSIRHDLNKEVLKDDDIDTLLDSAAFTLME